MPLPTQRAALILVGHGSTVNPDSSAPTHQHADELRGRGFFAEVVCAFWKEEPSMREVFYTVESDLIYIVPNFISEGYFTREVLPRELRIEGAITRRDGKTICFCDPVGIHPSMTHLLLHRAEEAAPGVPRGQISLIIVGHGTSLNENSRKAIEKQVALIREGGHGFAEVLDAYMEEAPFIARWHEMATAPNVVVVPFFIADGLHSYQDIPVLLGIESEPTAAASQNDVFRRNPYALRGRHLYYSSAVGTDPGMPEVILDQVKDSQQRFAEELAEAGQGSEGSISKSPTAELPRTTFVLGQVCAAPNADGSWTVHHLDDELSDSSLTAYSKLEDAREIASHDEAGEFRALKTAPNLRRGWRLNLPDAAALRLALDFLYPAMLGFWKHWRSNTLRPVPLRETLGRQTGMYRFTNTISDEQAQEMITCECDPKTKCLRRITWKLDADKELNLPPAKQPPTAAEAASIPLLCVEACTLVVSAAREIARRSQAPNKSGKT